MKLPITLKMSPLKYGKAADISIRDSDGAHLIDGCGCCGSPFTDDAEGLDAIVDAVNTHARLVEALEACLEWIDAVPDDAPLPAMPGFERDDVDMLIAAAKGDSHG